jgi:hypothetical protein
MLVEVACVAFGAARSGGTELYGMGTLRCGSAEGAGNPGLTASVAKTEAIQGSEPEAAFVLITPTAVEAAAVTAEAGVTESTTGGTTSKTAGEEADNGTVDSAGRSL